MFTCQGITINSWVDLDSSCEIRSAVHDGDLQIEFGPSGLLGLNIPEDVVDKLATVFAEAKERFHEPDGTTPDPDH